MTQFEEPTGAVEEPTGAVEGAVAEVVDEVVDGTADAATPVAEPAAATAPEPSVASRAAAALAELDTLPQRELAEHPEVYQRIHAELQSALATIDNA